MTVRWRAAGPLLALTCAVALAGCSDDEDPTAPVEVTVGEAFTWNDFTVDDGWEVKGIERGGIGVQEKVVTPEVSGTIVNNAGEERVAIFRMVFTKDGDAVTSVNCSADTMVEDQSMPFLCPGINTTMPADYDSITVTSYERDTGGSDDDSGT